MADSTRQHLISSKGAGALQSPVSGSSAEQAAYAASVQAKGAAPPTTIQGGKGSVFAPVDVGLPDASETLSASPEHQNTNPCGGCRDFIFIILFVLCLIGYGVLTGFSVHRGPDSNSLFGLECSLHSDGASNCLTMASADIERLLAIAGMAAAVALLLSGVAVSLTFVSPKWMGLFSMGVVSCYAIGFAVWGFMQQQIAMGVVGILLFLVELWTMYSFFVYHEFAAALVGATRAAAGSFRGTWVIGAVTAVCLLVWTVGWWASALWVLSAWGGAAAWGVLAFALLTFYWVLETIKNVGHVSVAGSVAHFFFVGPGVTRNPSWAAFFRAITLSFGSIVLGSLIVAVLQTLRRLFELMRMRGSRHWVAVLLSCIARVALVIIEALVRLFNVYVFTLISIYGMSYCEAARKTKRMFGQHGFEMVMQNNVIASIIIATSLAVCGACVGLAYALAVPAGFAPQHYVFAMIASGVVALFVVDGAFVVLFSGSCSTLMVYLVNPDVMRLRQPDLARLLDTSYAKFAVAGARAAATNANRR